MPKPEAITTAFHKERLMKFWVGNKAPFFLRFKQSRMYYRRKIELALLQLFDNELGKLEFQILLFLVSQIQEKSYYDFIPDKFGCFSFQANSDMRTMLKYNQVNEISSNSGEEIDTWQKIDSQDYFEQLRSNDQFALKRILNLYGGYSPEKLLDHVYKEYPYYAINSAIAKEHLGEVELNALERERPESSVIGLFSIGYEGKSLESYINELIRHDIKLLCDVRRNPKSMKYGFSKKQLETGCNSVGIEYLHLPELGIASDKRKMLNCQADYDLLFKEYEETTLKDSHDSMVEVFDLVGEHSRVALTCFEANIHQCHRKHLAEKIVNLPTWSYELTHI